MLAFERVSPEFNDEVLFDPRHLILRGMVGTDEASVRQHMAELAEHGVPPPSTFPLFYRVSASLVSQVSRLEVLGPHTSGEVEYVIVAMRDGLWITVGSDQTDRNAEKGVGSSPASASPAAYRWCSHSSTTTTWHQRDQRRPAPGPSAAACRPPPPAGTPHRIGTMKPAGRSANSSRPAA